MFSKTLLALAIAPALTLTPLNHTSVTTHILEQYRPETIVLPATIDAGSAISGTVVLSGAPTEDEVVTLAATPGYFTSLPSTVTVFAGSNYATFNATVASSASGTCSLTASDSEGSLTVTFTAQMSGGRGLFKSASNTMIRH